MSSVETGKGDRPITTATFDTLTADGDLENAGIETRHAKAIGTAISQSREMVATKADIDALRDATKADIDALRSATKADLIAAVAELKAEIFRALWIQGIGLVGVILTVAGLTVALVKLL